MSCAAFSIFGRRKSSRKTGKSCVQNQEPPKQFVHQVWDLTLSGALNLQKGLNTFIKHDNHGFNTYLTVAGVFKDIVEISTDTLCFEVQFENNNGAISRHTVFED